MTAVVILPRILARMSLWREQVIKSLSNRPNFLWVCQRDNPGRMLGEMLVNHVPKAIDLQAFRVFSQHP